MPEKRVLHYEIHEKLGAGGMGEVYRATDTRLGRDVALKFLPQSLQADTSARARLLREAQAASKLIHTNIVAIYAIEQDETGNGFIVMEYVPGQALDALITRDPLTIQWITDLAMQISEALSVAHAEGIVHRDIKPSNIIISERGQAKMLDFGLATFQGATVVTAEGSTMGTMAYMSPEQTQGSNVDTRSDIFSFGVVLYELITGRRPFEGDSTTALAQAIIHGTPEPLARYKASVPDDLQRVVEKALRKHPDERYQTAADILADLRALRRQLDTGAMSISGQAPTTSPYTPPAPYPPATPATPGQPMTPPVPGAPAQPMTPPVPGTPAHPMTPPVPMTPPQPVATPYPSGPATPAQPAAPAGFRMPPKIIGILAAAFFVVVVAAIFVMRGGNGEGVQEGSAPQVSATATSVAPAAKERVMLAVLPFENLGAEEDAYFADGISEEITARLASVDGLGVISRKSAAAYKGSDKTVQEIGKELGVDYVLDGTVRWQKATGLESRVRVTPELIRTSDATNVWADVYDEPAAEVFGVQSQIAQGVVRELGVQLLDGDQEELAAKPTQNMEAYDFYLRGMNALNETGAYDEATLAVAEQMFVKAIDLDPTFLKAYGQLARVHSDVFWFHVDRSEGRVLMAKATAERAMAIDPNSPDANAAMGWYYYHGRSDYPRALKSFGRALEGRPNNTDVISGIGFVQRRQGSMEAALVNLLKARELDPQSSEMHYSVGETLVALRRYTEAKRDLNESVAKFPGHEWMRLILARAYVWADGDITSARRVLEDATRVSLTSRVVFAAYNLELWARDFNAAMSGLKQIHYPADDNQFNYKPINYLYGWTYRLMENTQEAGARFEGARAHLEAQVASNPTDPRYPGTLAVTYAALGMRDQAIESMQRARELQSRAEDAWKTADRVHESALVWMLLDEHERAIDDLEALLKIYSGHNPRSVEIDPVWDPLRENPRFQALVASHS